MNAHIVTNINQIFSDKCVMETPFFFNNAVTGVRLFGMLYQPKEPIGIGIVFLHAFGPEREVGDTVFVNLARVLAAAGIVCLRFDYSGTGDSEGELRDLIAEKMFSDIDAAIDVIKTVEGVTAYGLFGLRFGGMLAALYAGQKDRHIDNLILCSPVIDFQKYIYNALFMAIAYQPMMFGKVIADRDKLLRNIASNEVTIYEGINLCNIDGYPLTYEFYSSFAKYNIFNGVSNYSKGCLVIDCCIAGKKKDLSIIQFTSRISGHVDYKEISMAAFPWTISSNLISSHTELNECVATWLLEREGEWKKPYRS